MNTQTIESGMNPFSAHILHAILREGEVLLNYRIGVADGITLFSRRGVPTSPKPGSTVQSPL